MAGSKADDSDDSARSVILIVRHGIAEERTEDKPDSERSLTKTGHARMRENARGIARLFPKAELILSSPLLRALQTALWVSRAFKKKVEVEVTDALAPEGSTAEVAALLEQRKERGVILVGHEPNLTETMRHLASQAGWRGDLKKGGCYLLRREEGSLYLLESLLTPKILRLIAKS